MEHRLGHRLKIDTAIRLRTSRGRVTSAELADISLSGAFIRTDMGMAPASFVHLTLPLPEDAARENVAVQATVIRSTSCGIGIEWMQFAPGAVKAILSGRSRHSMTMPRRSKPGRCCRAKPMR